MARRWVATQPDSPTPYAILADLLHLQGRTTEANAALVQASSRGLDVVTQFLTASSIAMREENYRLSDSILETHLAAGSVHERFEAAFQLAISLRAQGRFDSALAVLARSRDAYAGTPSERLNERGNQLQVGQAQLEAGRPTAAIAAFDSTTRLLDPREAPATRDRVRLWALVQRATVYASLGDTLMLRQLADSAELLASTSRLQRSRALPAYARALQLEAAGKHDEVSALLRSVTHSPTTGLQTFDLLLARALVAAGRPREAIGVLQSVFRGYRSGGGLYTTQTELHAALASAWEAAGNADSARAHWARVAGAWKAADPVLAGRQARANEKVAAR